MSQDFVLSPVSFARRHFEGAALSDRRRVQRASKIAAALATAPGSSLPKACATPYDTKAAYTLFDHAEATPDNLQAGHRQLVQAQLAEPGAFLLLEDTTEFVWHGKPIEGLSMTSAKNGQGFLLHSVLAVRWPSEDQWREQRPPLEVLGLADQQYYLRQPIPPGEKGNDSAKRKSRERESQLWERSGERIGAAPDGVRWTRVCDRGADIYEFMQACRQLGHGFVVRAAQDRLLEPPATDKLFATTRQAEPVTCFDLPLRARPKQPARMANLLVSTQEVQIRSPARPGKARGALPPIPCTVVRVWEPELPASGEPLEWILLVDRPVTTPDEALACARQYAGRWLIEEFHKALKTGLGAEDLQLETGHRLFAAIAIMSVVALRLISLKEGLRLNPGAPAEEAGLEPEELQVLRAYLKRKPIRTVQDVALGIGRLGGHMNRKGDGMPGMITLWRGMSRLLTLVEGARLAHQAFRFG